jgi:hypothetical protein
MDSAAGVHMPQQEATMSDTVRTLVESLFMIGAITAGLVWYAIVAGRRENGEARQASVRPKAGTTLHALDPDAHLGHSGAE